MSYTRQIGDMKIYINCKADPETNYAMYYGEIEKEIIKSGYTPEALTMEDLIAHVILCFDCDDNYGDYDEETGFGGYGNEFTMGGLLNYVSDCGGWKEFDHEI